jgi:hypothetical protein
LDPIVIGHIITGLVGTLSAYTTYKLGIEGLREKKLSQNSKEPEIDTKKGAIIETVIDEGIETYGRAAEKLALSGYKQNPRLFEQAIIQVLSDIASRSPDFVTQLQNLEHLAEGRPNTIQTAIGTNIAQASHGSSASVSIGSKEG